MTDMPRDGSSLMRLREIMSTRVVTIRPKEAASEAWTRMRRRRNRHLVVMEDTRLVGVLSERDLGGRSGADIRTGRKGIKVFGPTYTDTLTALCDEARKVGIGVAIHVGIGQADAAVASKVGVTSIEHWYGIPDAAIPGVQQLPADYNVMDELDRFRYAGKLWRDADPELLEQVMNVFIKNSTVLDPTFVTYEPNRDLVRAHEPTLVRKSMPSR